MRVSAATTLASRPRPILMALVVGAMSIPAAAAAGAGVARASASARAGCPVDTREVRGRLFDPGVPCRPDTRVPMTAGAPSVTGQAPTAPDPGAAELARLIDGIPPHQAASIPLACLGTPAASSVFGAQDQSANGLDTLDVISDPRPLLAILPRYLGVYHGGDGIHVKLARSCDLATWTYAATLAGPPLYQESAANDPQLAAAPNGGFVLAYEGTSAIPRRLTTGADVLDHQLHVAYYRSRSDLLAAQPTAEAKVRITIPSEATAASAIAINGTPDIRGVTLDPACPASPLAPLVDPQAEASCLIIDLGYHYLDTTAAPAVDREASGTIEGFGSGGLVSFTQTAPAVGIDSYLETGGYPGNHGERTEFAYKGRTYRIYEAAKSPTFPFPTFRLFLYDVAENAMQMLAPVDPGFASQPSLRPESFGNPTAQVVPSPTGSGQALVTNMFNFNYEADGKTLSPELGGELTYYSPVG